MKKRLVALTLTCALAATALAGCGGSTGGDSTASGDSTAATETSTAEGSVYYLNFKPEQDQQWQDLAKAYTEETGVPVTVVTAASGNYETTLMSEMGKSGAPTLFQVNGPVGLANWKDYCYDLSGSDIYGQLTSDNYALKEGDTVYGVAYVIESYGLITNKTLLEKAGYTIDDIKSFADLKKVAEDITARSSELGFAAFTSAGMDDLLTGDSRPIWQTCRSTLSIRQMASAAQMQSKEPILTTTVTSGICTSTTAPAIRQNSLLRPVMIPEMNSWQAMQSSSRMVPGSMVT